MKGGYTNSEPATRTFTLSRETVATPTFSPAMGDLTTAATLTISSSTDDVTISYTVNGNPPPNAISGGDSPYPVELSDLSPGEITIVAVAMKGGYTDSEPATRTFTLSRGTAATPSFNRIAEIVPPTESLTISTATRGAQIRYTSDESLPEAGSTLYTSPISFAAFTSGVTTIVQAIAVKEGVTNSALGEDILYRSRSG